MAEGRGTHMFNLDLNLAFDGAIVWQCEGVPATKLRCCIYVG